MIHPHPHPRPRHSSLFFPSCSFLSPPPNHPVIHVHGIGRDSAAAGGYGFPLTWTRGSQVHQSEGATPARACGMWLPQPRHVFFAVPHRQKKASITYLCPECL